MKDKNKINIAIAVGFLGMGVLSIVFFFMLFTFSAFSWYFGRKGDME